MEVPKNQLAALPLWGSVDVGKLSVAFTHTTTSYKYLFFKAIMMRTRHRAEEEAMGGRPFDGVLTFTELRDEMLVNSWVPSREFRLNLGFSDRINQALDEVQGVFEENGYAPDDTADSVREGLERFAGSINERGRCRVIKDMDKFVRYRFLTPWFDDELKRRPRGDRHGLIVRLSDELFDSAKPLYRLLDGGERVEIHPDWLQYIRYNHVIVDGWLDHQWIKYLQDRNPTVPAISKKIWALPAQRDTGELATKRRYWKPLLEQGFRCIYFHEERVDKDDFDLDHFMPWSWVGHDQLWNLVPTSARTNRAKGARIPHKPEHVGSLADANIRMLEFVQKRLGGEGARPRGVSWSTVVNDYGSGLNVRIGDRTEKLDTEAIKKAYTSVIMPQVGMAIDRGFQKWL